MLLVRQSSPSVDQGWADFPENLNKGFRKQHSSTPVSLRKSSPKRRTILRFIYAVG